jgi:hypothetical protein
MTNIAAVSPATVAAEERDRMQGFAASSDVCWAHSCPFHPHFLFLSSFRSQFSSAAAELLSPAAHYHALIRSAVSLSLSLRTVAKCLSPFLHHQKQHQRRHFSLFFV